jgi:hypothetical protein
MTEILDIKLKNLILACKETGNYKKLAVTGFILLSNIVDEISLKLGMRPRDKEKGEKIIEYMYMVNEIFEKNLKIQIFTEGVIETVKEVELLFLEKRGDIPYQYIKKLYNIYYELRKLEIPNLYKNITGEEYFENSNLHMLNYLSPKVRQRKDKSNKFKPLLLQKIREQERRIQGELNTKLSQTSLERIIFLKNIKRSLDHNGKRKIVLQGTLKDNMEYESSENKIIRFAFIGVAFLVLFLSLIMLVEIVFYPFMLKPLSNLLLISFGMLFFLVVLYKHYFIKR